jgi:hypothetical protein
VEGRWNIDGTVCHVLRIVDRYRSHLLIATAATVVVGVMAVSGCARLNPNHKPAAAASAPASDPASGQGGAGSTGDGNGGLAPGSPSPGGPTASTSAVLPDGRSASYLKTVDLSKHTITFDLIQLLFGADATKEWVKKHPDEPDGPPEGYLLTNDNKKLRTISFAADVVVKVIDLNSSNPSVARPIPLADLPRHLSGERNAPLPYWLTVEQGQVTIVQEEYLA